MTPAQLSDALTRLNMKPADLARQAGVTRGAVSLWLSGKQTIPGSVIELIRTWLSQVK